MTMSTEDRALARAGLDLMIDAMALVESTDMTGTGSATTMASTSLTPLTVSLTSGSAVLLVTMPTRIFSPLDTVSNY
jgi:hypothetical protein